ncbi:hypothetical protein BJX68DRAFT_228035 [Aspergillus pseudodeflectus]|uniref:Transcription factor domain-containing protein n=1 Tax=Aspergillus pseudodeflectus TaxID=176178 RepID=A0ABR4L150_9EURO
MGSSFVDDKAHLGPERHSKPDENRRSLESRRQKQDPQASSRMVARKPNRPAILLPRLTIDELVAPRLAEQALSTQTTESFHGWLMYYFPRSYSSFSHRVDTNWMDFLRGLQPSVRSHALMWALRALVMFQMGTLQGNANAIDYARSMYGRGVGCLRSLLQTPFALTEEALAASVLLGGYEILDGSSEDTWISHTRGIRQIMCARGAAAHKTGISRTLLLSFRPFLVAESFVLGEPCFLGDPDWISITKDIYKEEEQTRESTLGRIMDYAFDEITKCPGYYAAAQGILTSQVETVETLLGGISESKECLNNLKAQLLTIPEDESLTSTAASSQSIPPSYVRSLAQLTCGGIDSSLAMLDQLTSVLRSDRDRRGRANTASPAANYQKNPWYVPLRQESKMYNECPLKTVQDDSPKSPNPSVNVQSIGDRLDKFSLNMGVASMSGSSPIQAAALGRFVQPQLPR